MCITHERELLGQAPVKVGVNTHRRGYKSAMEVGIDEKIANAILIAGGQEAKCHVTVAHSQSRDDRDANDQRDLGRGIRTTLRDAVTPHAGSRLAG